MSADGWGWEVNDPDVIARATASDGREVLLLMAPAAALDGSDGPVVIPGFDSDRVHVVLSDEFIERYVIAEDDSAETVREKLALLSYAVRESLSLGIDALDGRL
jgi:hypothetical protein